jgi:hypothetical protein
MAALSPSANHIRRRTLICDGRDQGGQSRTTQLPNPALRPRSIDKGPGGRAGTESRRRTAWAGHDEGMAEGMVEGMAEGMVEGMAEGMVEGMAEQRGGVLLCFIVSHDHCVSLCVCDCWIRPAVNGCRFCRGSK